MSRGPLAALHQLDKITFRGAKFHENIAAAVTDASVSLGTDQVSELSVTFADPALDLALSDHITLGTSVLIEELMMKVASIEVGPGPSGTGGMTFAARSSGVTALRARQGALVMRNASPTDFVRAECKAVNLKLVAQATEKRKQIKRDVKKKGSEGGDGTPSSWTTFQRLASECGFYLFEVAGTVYFGQPTWLINATQDVKVGWRNVDEAIRASSVPTCRQSVDSTDGMEVTCEVPYNRASEMRPGRALNLIGMGRFSDRYLITSVDYSLAGLGPVSITAVTPKNPAKQKPQTSGSSNNGDGVTVRGIGQYAVLVNAARDAGFTGDALVTAVAIAIAESGGNVSAVSPVNSNGTRDYGAWQINSVHRSEGFDTTLALNAEYNAKWAWKLSSHGTNWRPWSTYWSHPFSSGAGQGAYQQYMSAARGSVEKSSVNSSVATTAHGRQSAYDFVNICLRQAGDRYSHAEVNLADTNPSAFDCSELVQWAAHQTGVYMPDGSWIQQAYCKRKGTMISVDRALATRGALLWWGDPAHHVAVSLGGHRGTIEASDYEYGVRTWSTQRSFSWTNAGLVPGMKY